MKFIKSVLTDLLLWRANNGDDNCKRPSVETTSSRYATRRLKIKKAKNNRGNKKPTSDYRLDNIT